MSRRRDGLILAVAIVVILVIWLMASAPYHRWLP